MQNIPVNNQPLGASAIGGEVLIKSCGQGVQICAAMTPDAVLASLEPLRRAAEQAKQPVLTLKGKDEAIVPIS